MHEALSVKRWNEIKNLEIINCHAELESVKQYFTIRDHPVSTYTKFSEKLTFLTPRYAHVPVRIKRLEIMVFRKILRTYSMDDPLRLIN